MDTYGGHISTASSLNYSTYRELRELWMKVTYTTLHERSKWSEMKPEAINFFKA